MVREQASHILFLHGGPGMTAEIERRQYGNTLPIRWWDQPRMAGVARPYEALVDAAVTEVCGLSRKLRGPVDLLASSFGAYLARSLVDRIPEQIGAVTICGGVWDLRSAFLKLGQWFAARYPNVELGTACADVQAVGDRESYGALLARIASIPDYFECYWSPSAGGPREAMHALAAEGRLIDMPTFQSVLAEVLMVSQEPLPAPHPGGVRILIGEFDPYFNGHDIPEWKRLWPGALVELVEAGHFPHLELPPAEWMPVP